MIIRPLCRLRINGTDGHKLAEDARLAPPLVHVVANPDLAQSGVQHDGDAAEIARTRLACAHLCPHIWAFTRPMPIDATVVAVSGRGCEECSCDHD